MVKQSGVPMFFKVFMIIFIILAVGLPTAYLTNKHVKKYVDKLLGKSNGLNRKVKSCEETFGKNHDYEKSIQEFQEIPHDVRFKYDTLDFSKEYDQEIYDRGAELVCREASRYNLDEIKHPIDIRGKTCKEWKEARLTFSGEPEREYSTNSYRKGVVDACALFGQ